MSDRKCATFGAILAASLSFCASTGAAAEPPGELSLRDAVATLFATYERAWGRSDAKALAATYTSRGDLRIPTGRIFSGRSSIEAFYAGAFARGYGKTLADGVVQRVRLLSLDVAIIDGTWSIQRVHIARAKAHDEHGTFNAVILRTHSAWKLAALREQA